MISKRTAFKTLQQEIYTEAAISRNKLFIHFEHIMRNNIYFSKTLEKHL